MHPTRPGLHLEALAAFWVAATGCSDFRISGQDTAVQPPVEITEQFVQAALPDVDILWVMDDTRSMADEQAAVIDALDVFTQALAEAELSWQVGVVTTDVTAANAGELVGNPWILTPSVDDPLAALQATLAVGTSGSEPASGLAAAWLALTDPLASGANRGFRRPGAALHVIVVSDGDDHSADIFAAAGLGSDPAAAFSDFLDDQAASNGQPAMLSAIVGPRGTGCSGSGGTALPGDIYIDVAESTGGAVGEVCESDLSGVAATVGAATVVLPDTFPLQVAAVPDSIRVSVDGSRTDTGWTYDDAPPAVIFEEAPPAGAAVEIHYEVEES